MKKVILTIFTLMISTPVIAEVLLQCEPPMGSRLQKITIFEEDGQILRQELNSSGARSAKKVVSAQAWGLKNIRWTSPKAGQVHLYQVKMDGELYWAFESKSPGSAAIGYCRE